MLRSDKDATEQSRASITALYVHHAFVRALRSRYNRAFSAQEEMLAGYLLAAGKQSLPSGYNSAIFNSFNLFPQKLQRSYFDFLCPGYDNIIMLRKWEIRDLIDREIANGTTQVIIVSGGLDVRAFVASHQYPNVKFFELDRGITREAKINALRTLPTHFGFPKLSITVNGQGTAQINNNLFYIHCDLATTTLPEAVLPYGFQPDQPCLVVAEGLTIYLDEEGNKRLLNSINGLLALNSKFFVSYVAPLLQTLQNAICKKWLQKSHEAYHFMMEPSEVIPFVQQFGFDIEGKFYAADHLDEIGDTANARSQVEKRSSVPEYYYLLNKTTTPDPARRLEDIPNMPITTMLSSTTSAAFAAK